MSSSAALEKRTQARAASRLLADVPGVQSVALFGSVARGDAESTSDIDLIVLGDSDELTSSELRRRLSPALAGVDISVSYHTPASLLSYLKRWSRFGAHLRLESTILYDQDGVLGQILASDRPIDTRYELASQARNLARFEHVERFGGRFLFPLAHLYRIGRAATFAAIANKGQLEFDRRQALRIAADLYPGLEPDFRVIAGLEPFYERVRSPEGVGASDLPFDPAGPAAERHFIDARASVARIIELGGDK